MNMVCHIEFRVDWLSDLFLVSGLLQMRPHSLWEYAPISLWRCNFLYFSWGVRVRVIARKTPYLDFVPFLVPPSCPSPRRKKEIAHIAKVRLGCNRRLAKTPPGNIAEPQPVVCSAH